MNPLSRLTKHLIPETEKAFEDLSPEEQQVILDDEKKARVEWHRRSVRNGPVRYSTISTGQQRRMQVRDQATRQRKANKNHRRNFFARRQEAATLLGHLQGVGAIPYATEGLTPTTAQRLRSGGWLVLHFAERYEKDTSDKTGFHAAGDIIESDDLFVTSLQAAKDRYAALIGAPVKA